MSRIRPIGPILLLALALSSCATTSRHQFTDPGRDWKTRSGQLLYKSAKTSLIGEVLVRFSKSGDFELTFSKGPGLTLLHLRQDGNFASFKGPLARGGWSGATAQAPARLRGWLQLRDKVLASPNKPSISHSEGGESFTFRF